AIARAASRRRDSQRSHRAWADVDKDADGVDWRRKRDGHRVAREKEPRVVRVLVSTLQCQTLIPKTDEDIVDSAFRAWRETGVRDAVNGAARGNQKVQGKPLVRLGDCGTTKRAEKCRRARVRNGRGARTRCEAHQYADGNDDRPHRTAALEQPKCQPGA